MAVVSTFFNTRPFAFRWKKEQGYLDDSGPNGGATVKCLAIKQFCPASVLIRWINSVCCFEWSRSSQTNLVIHHTKRWCCVCGRPTCSVIIRDPTIRGVRLSPGGGTLCPFKPNATASNVKYPLFAHKSSCSVIVSDVVLWGSSLMGWPLHFLWKKGNMQTSGMKPELSALFFSPLPPILFPINPRICEPTWLAEWRISKKGCCRLYVSPADLIRSEATAPWGTSLAWLIDVPNKDPQVRRKNTNKHQLKCYWGRLKLR